MERMEFLKGWVYLTLQPWGRQYRDGQPEAHLQLEYYWRHVCRVNSEVWKTVCEYAAQGDHWPSLTELKQSIQANIPSAPQELLARLPAMEWATAPSHLHSIFKYVMQYHTTVKEAALIVLPHWLDDNPDHEDYEEAKRFLARAQSNFGIRGEAGNIRVPI